MTSRLTLLVASVRLPPGLLTKAAWEALADADLICARSLDEPLAEAITASGYAVQVLPESGAHRLLAAAREQRVLWLGSTDGDPGLSEGVARELTRLDNPPTVDVIVGSWDPPGARLLDVVAVMDRLRSPGGCPWDAEQTHTSLARYLLEEAQEAVEAIASGDREHLIEELGDVLLQVVFHARVGQEGSQTPFDIDAVAATLVEKLVRRHPHVFADGQAKTAAEVEVEWARIKGEEKADKAARLAAARNEPGRAS